MFKRLFEPFCHILMKQDAEAAFLVYDFASYHHVADIGGGNGTFLFLLLQQYSEMQATLFDLSTAGSQARAYCRRAMHVLVNIHRAC